MIYVTGDLHGDMSRFRTKAFRKLRKNDTLIVLGDFGFLWDGSKAEERRLRWIGRRKYQVLFIEGTHDNLDLLSRYVESGWCGGRVREIAGKLRHLSRGHIFEIEGRSLFVFGGGESSDADARGGAWWARELPSPEEISAARERLEAHGNAVDCILTHQCSRKLKILLGGGEEGTNVLDAFFDEIRQRVRHSRWFFGGYHMNKMIPPREMAVYDAVVSIDGAEAKR